MELMVYLASCAIFMHLSDNDDILHRLTPLLNILPPQIFNWLSNSPSEMESYIRPGCVILSVYVSMPSAAWEQVSGFCYSLGSIL